MISVALAAAVSASRRRTAAAPVVPPNINSFTVGPQDGNDLPLSIEVTEGSDPPNTVYVVAVPENDPAPSAQQIADGEDSEGDPAALAIDFEMDESGIEDFNIDPTPADGTYDFYAVAVDDEGRFSDVATALGVEWEAAESGPVELFFDDFNRANTNVTTALGADWQTRSGGWRIDSNQARSANADAQVTIVKSSAAAVAGNQYARFALTSSNNTNREGMGPAVRMSESGDLTGYFADWGSGDWRIRRLDTSGSTTLSSEEMDRPDQNDVVELRVVGTELSLFVNDTLILQATDSTYSSGQPGARATWFNRFMDDFSCGDVE